MGSPLSLEAAPLLDVTSPTLPELSTSPRGRLRLMPRLTPTTLSDTMDSATPDTTVWDTLDTPATPMPDSATTTVSATDTTPTLLPPLPLLLPLSLPLPLPSRLRPLPSPSPLPSSTTPLLLATPMSPPPTP